MPHTPEEYLGLGVFIKEARIGLGVSQKYVADRLNVSTSYVCQVEKGTTRASDAFLERMNSALELRPGTLLLKIGKPTMDLMRTLLQPGSNAEDPLTTITSDEREELIRYLNFIRVQARLRELSGQPPITSS